MNNILIEINGLFLMFFLGMTKLFYNVQKKLLQSEYPKDHNITFELGNIIVKEKSKSSYIQGPLNNYTAQSMILEENKDKFFVSLNIPFEEKDRAYEAYCELKNKFKKDEELLKYN